MQGDSFVPPVWTYLAYTLSSIFPFPESIEHFNTLCVSVLLIKKEFFPLSADTQWKYIFFCEFILNTQRQHTLFIYLRRNVKLPGLITLQIPIKCEFWKIKHFAIFDWLFIPRLLAFHSHLPLLSALGNSMIFVDYWFIVIHNHISSCCIQSKVRTLQSCFHLCFLLIFTPSTDLLTP